MVLVRKCLYLFNMTRTSASVGQLMYLGKGVRKKIEYEVFPSKLV